MWRMWPSCRWLEVLPVSKVQGLLQWRHNGVDGVSNHQPHDCLLNRLFCGDQRKYQSSASLAFLGNPPKWPVTRKMFPFDDVIMVSGELGDSHTYIENDPPPPWVRALQLSQMLTVSRNYFKWQCIIYYVFKTIKHMEIQWNVWSFLAFWQWSYTQIAKFMGPTWAPSGSCRPQMGPMLAPWTLLSG